MPWILQCDSNRSHKARRSSKPILHRTREPTCLSGVEIITKNPIMLAMIFFAATERRIIAGRYDEF